LAVSAAGSSTQLICPGMTVRASDTRITQLRIRPAQFPLHLSSWTSRSPVSLSMVTVGIAVLVVVVGTLTPRVRYFRLRCRPAEAASRAARQGRPVLKWVAIATAVAVYLVVAYLTDSGYWRH
jgi:hypothetical protein